MNLKVNEAGKSKIISLGIVAVITVLTYFACYRFDELKVWLSSTVNLLFPFIFGFAVAFLLNQPMVMFEKMLTKLNLKAKTVRILSAILAILLGIVVVSAFFTLLISQIIPSILNLIEQAPEYISRFSIFVEEFVKANELDLSTLYEIYGYDIESNFFAYLTSFFSTSLPQMVTMTGRAASTLFNVILGIMAGLYMLLEKEKFKRGTKRFVFAFFSENTAHYLVRFSKITSDVFNNFIIGKAIDSLIIGILCYILMTLFKMPYALLLSVIVGVTNMIPVFGPFIGAVPGIFILTIIHPIHGLYFALLILAIQQFDGNILGPIILGDKLGLPSLAILFAVVVGGGLFGILGMFIGVPIFAVGYIAIKEIVDDRISKKGLEIN